MLTKFSPEKKTIFTSYYYKLRYCPKGLELICSMRKEKLYNAAKDLPHDTFYLILTQHKEMFNKEKIMKNESL